LPARERVGNWKTGNEKAEDADDFVGGKIGASHQLDDAVGEDPAGEAADGENDPSQVGMARLCSGLKEIGLGIGGQDGGSAVGSTSRVIWRV
jgi:hypothetical protein